MPELPFGWTPQYETPNTNIIVIFLLFDVVVFFVIFGFYKTSVNNFRISLNFPILRTTSVKMSDHVNSGIKLCFLGLFFIISNNIIAHLSVLISPYLFSGQYAYFMVGYNGFFSAIGVALNFIGTGMFQNQYFKTFLRSEQKIFANYILGFAILSFLTILYGIATFWRSSLYEYGFKVFLSYFFIWIFILSLVTIYSVFIIEYPNKILKTRFFLLIGVFSILSFYIVVALFFIPTTADIEVWKTRNSEIELFFFMYNLLSILVAILYYLIVSFPQPLREWLDIDDREYVAHNYEIWGENPPERIFINLEEQEHQPLTVPNFDEKNYIVFSDLTDNDIASTLIHGVLNEKLEITEVFGIEQLTEKTYHDEIKSHANQIIISNEVKAPMEYILDEIYVNYNWDIDTKNDKIIFNDYLYSHVDYEFALIVSAFSGWNFRRRILVLLFSEKLANNMMNFLNKYLTFVEDISLQKSFVMVLFFDKANGSIVDIPEDTEFPGTPSDNHYKIFD